MTEAREEGRPFPSPAGIRLVDGAVNGSAPTLVYADPSGLDLEVGDRVVIVEAGRERVGEVVVAPRQVLESALLGPLPRVVRRARPDEWPARRVEGAGAVLLRSLELTEPASGADSAG